MLVLLEDAGLRVHRAEQALTARAADTVMARALEVPLGTALLSVQRVATERSGRPGSNDVVARWRGDADLGRQQSGRGRITSC